MEEHFARRLAAGATIQHYEVIRPLGEGGMGVVYLARDTRLGRRVALKMLTSCPGDPVDRFLIEAQATAQLSHENIIVIHEIGEHDGMPYMVLEYLRGKTFDQILRDLHGPAPPEAAPDAPPQPRAAVGLPPGRAVELMIPVLRALAFAHEHGIIHRDLKPSNIFWTDTGLVKVLDFGLAKAIGTNELPLDPRTPALDEASALREAITQTSASARNATRMATARELLPDPTTVLALLREVEPPNLPPGWDALARWALDAGVARVILRHPGIVTSAAWSPDGTRIVTVSEDNMARVWNADGSGPPLVLRGHEASIWSAAWSPDGTRILTASGDKTARVWNADGSAYRHAIR